MEIREVRLIPRGMNQDISISKFNTELSYENHNIRIAAIDYSTGFSIENERGPELINLTGDTPINGYCIGYAVLNDYLVLFTTTSDPGQNNGTDYIYRIDNLSQAKLLYSGNLGFDPDYPIEALSYYENENVQKVYWTDGLNPPKVINIVADDSVIANWNDDSFSFTPGLQLNETVRITQSHSGGQFASGVVQYAFSYYNLFSAESALAWTGDIRYLGNFDRGLSPEEISTDSFTIDILNADTNFQYLRLYAIHRSSLNTTPSVRLVGDFPVTTNMSLIDTGTLGSDLEDPSVLLFLGGEDLIIGTITSKDNTLFGGNIKFNRNSLIYQEVQNRLNPELVNFDIAPSIVYLEDGQTAFNNLYTYRPHLADNDTYFVGANVPLQVTDSNLRTFKEGQSYRLGIQFQNTQGFWSEPVYIGEDIFCTTRPRYTINRSGQYVTVQPVWGYLNIPQEVINYVTSQGYVKARPIYVYPELSDRNVVCQGIATPVTSIYNLRQANAPTVQSDWLTRPYNWSQTEAPDQYQAGSTSGNNNYTYAIPRFHHQGSIGGNGVYPTSTTQYQVPSEIRLSYDYTGTISGSATGGTVTSFNGTTATFPDDSIIDLWSPDIQYYETLDQYIQDATFHIVGIASVSNTLSAQSVVTDAGTDINTSGQSLSNNWTVPPFPNAPAASWRGYFQVNSFYYYPWTSGTYATGSTITNNTLGQKVYALCNYYFDRNLTYTMPIYSANQILEGDGLTVVPIVGSPGDNSGTVNYSTGLEENVFASSGTNSTPIRYRTNSHIAITLSEDTSISGLNYTFTLPSLWPSGTTGNTYQYYRPGYREINYGYIKRPLRVDDYFEDTFMGTAESMPFLWIAELRRILPGQYGGYTETAIQNNLWIVAGESIRLDATSQLQWTDGDCFIRRYDCVRSFPLNEDQVNKVSSVVSFLGEFHYNTDGRYDRNRYNSDVRSARPTNYGLLNEVYSQNNNFFNYRLLNFEQFSATEFPHQVIWSQEKQSGSLTDNWTNLSSASTLDLDGTLGTINALRTYNSEIISFQDKGIANILFNSRVQIPTSDDIPIEISNNYKVSGYRYISNQIGSRNKWSINESKRGIYFIDELNKTINFYNGSEIRDISAEGGFSVWAYNNIINTDPLTLGTELSNFSTNVDKITEDIYFINKDTALCYSEGLNDFMSFFSYGNIPYITNNFDESVAIRNVYPINNPKRTELYKLYSGQYNQFFDFMENSSIKYHINPDGYTDKVFNNVEYRADFFSEDNNGRFTTLVPDQTFTSYQAKTEYQDTGAVVLDGLYNRNPRLRRKFRTWRFPIGRDTKESTSNNLNRIRNPWLELTMTYGPSEAYDLRFVLHDLIVKYTI